MQIIRDYFESRDILEIHTRLMNPCATVEAHLDSFQIVHKGIQKSNESMKTTPRNNHNKPEFSWLITSPEYNLKKVVAQTKKSHFQIAHCFREGDIGTWHREEFLMLEFYLVDARLEDLMKFCERLLTQLASESISHCDAAQVQYWSIDNLFKKHVDCGLDWPDLYDAAKSNKLIQSDSKDILYDDLFYLVFLNLIEPHLRKNIHFIYDYPTELASYSKVRNHRARRFEIYWNGIELGNGYEELQSYKDYLRAFANENKHRKTLHKDQVRIDESLIRILEQYDGLPVCSGIAIGLDRLIAILFVQKDIHTNNTMSL